MAVSVGGDDSGAISEINVTPMVDVLLCLLIIFMVATPPPANDQMPLDIPTNSKTQGPADPNATLLLTVDAAGSAKLGNQAIGGDYAAIVDALKANQKVQTDGKLAIEALPGVKYGQVIRMMEAAHEAGVNAVGIASDRL